MAMQNHETAMLSNIVASLCLCCSWNHIICLKLESVSSLPAWD